MGVNLDFEAQFEYRVWGLETEFGLCIGVWSKGEYGWCFVAEYLESGQDLGFGIEDLDIGFEEWEFQGMWSWY